MTNGDHFKQKLYVSCLLECGTDWRNKARDDIVSRVFGSRACQELHVRIVCTRWRTLSVFQSETQRVGKKWRRERNSGGWTAGLPGLTVHHRCCRPSVATRRVRTFLKFNMWQRWLSIFPSTRIVRFGPCIWPFRMSMSNFPSLLFGSNTADQVGHNQRSLLWATNCLYPL